MKDNLEKEIKDLKKRKEQGILTGLDFFWKIQNKIIGAYDNGELTQSQAIKLYQKYIGKQAERNRKRRLHPGGEEPTGPYPLLSVKTIEFMADLINSS